MKQVFDDNGLRHLELEFLMDWFLDEDDERRRASDEIRELLLDAAGELDAHHIKVGNIPGTPAEIPQLTERFGELCAEAAARTDAKIVYEFMPFDANVNSVDAALEVVGGAGADNGGIAIDTWHMSKLGIAPDELRRIPVEYLSWVELSDGRLDDMDDLVDETVNHRELPGEGEFDLRGYVEVCRDHGYPGPWGVEVLSEELRNQPDGRDLPAGVRDDGRPIRTREELCMSASEWTSRSSTATGWSGCTSRCCASGSSRSGSSAPSSSIRA